jgi:pantoate kinase
MGNIQIISRGEQWVVIQRGNLNDLSAHPTLDEAMTVARDVAARCGAQFVAPAQAAHQ